jgi:hypothetical protein
MKRIVTDLLIVFVLSLGTSSYLLAQSLTADRFLAGVSAHPVGDEMEHTKADEIAAYLRSASRPEVESVLPAVLASVRSGGEPHARLYATEFLIVIAMQLDGADLAVLLSSSSEEISSLIVDSNPEIQKMAVDISGFVIGKAGTNNQPYMSAMQTAIQRLQTPQDAGVNIIVPLLTLGRSDPGALKSVLAFLQRDDLTASTRSQLVYQLGESPGLPEEINQYPVKGLGDPDPSVRASAVVAFANSTTEYHTLAKDRVERIAVDSQENSQVRQLAKEALAGKTALSPDIDLPPDKPNNLTADRFLEGVAARPVGDQVEQDQCLAIYRALNTAPPAEVERELQDILQYVLSGKEIHARKYAALLLTAIAIRPDGAALLSSKSEEISSLIVDADPGIQRAAVTVAFWAGPNQQRYVSAFEAAIKRVQTPQDIDVQMVSSLARIGSGDPDALKSVLDFMQRDDLTVSTRSDLVHFLGAVPGLPKEIDQALAKGLDDTDPTVRAAAVVAFADSTTAFHTLAKSRVEGMANDAQENPKVRELAKEVLAGQTHLNPNVLVPNAEILPEKPADH